MTRHPSFLQSVLFLALCFLASCGHVMPGNFWTELHKKYIIQNISDQGPWGGHREILWESNKPMTFSVPEVIKFAQSHGWKFVDSSYHYSSQSKTWDISNSKEAPPPFQNAYFDKWPQTDWRLLRFDSKGTKESEAGSGEFVTSFGNILVNNDGSKMMFIHVWGE